MKEKRCLYCYQPVQDRIADYHPKCSKKLFGTETPPMLDYSNGQMQELATEIILRSVAVTGVQPKLSLTIEKEPGNPKQSRFTIVGLWGGFILKPPSEEFANLPENEDLTMHLAKLFDIPVAEHGLIRLKSGELSYITKRFDRIKGKRLPLEDMCQLTETLTIDKYKSSMEKIGKCIAKYSATPGLDAIAFFEMAVFCFLTGNADMHLKNFSLLTSKTNGVGLSPAYDMLCTKMALPEDKEEMALTINGKKRKLKKTDFDSLAKNLNIPDKTVANSYKKFADRKAKVFEFIDISFLPDTMKEDYKRILMENFKQIELL